MNFKEIPVFVQCIGLLFSQLKSWIIEFTIRCYNTVNAFWCGIPMMCRRTNKLWWHSKMCCILTSSNMPFQNLPIFYTISHISPTIKYVFILLKIKFSSVLQISIITTWIDTNPIISQQKLKYLTNKNPTSENENHFSESSERKKSLFPDYPSVTQDKHTQLLCRLGL